MAQRLLFSLLSFSLSIKCEVDESVCESERERGGARERERERGGIALPSRLETHCLCLTSSANPRG